MGKERVRRRFRFNPMAATIPAAESGRVGDCSPVVANEETEMPIEECCSSEELVAGLRSTVESEKMSAATFLSGLANDVTSRHEALRPEVIRAAAPLLLDKAAGIVHCIAQWLRDVSHVGPELCETLVQENVVAHLLSLLRKLIRNESSSIGEARRGVVLLDSVNALTNLCENCEAAVEIVTRGKIAVELFPLLVAAGASKVPITAAQCLLTLTEDNPPLQLDLFPQLEMLRSLLQDPLLGPSHLLFKTTIAGIAHNISSSSLDLLPLLVATARAALEHDIADQLSSLKADICRLQQLKQCPDTQKRIDSRLVDIYETLQAKKTALELLVNMCYTADEEEEQWVDCDDDDEDAMSIRSCGTSEMRESIPAELQAALGSAQLLTVVLNHIGPLDVAMVACLNEYKAAQQIGRDIHDVRCRAMLLVDNLAQSLDLLQVSTPDKIREISSNLLQIAFSTQTENNHGNTELLEAASSACRAVLEVLARTGQSAPVLTEEELSCLCGIVLGKGGSSTGRVNVTRIVATLATLHRPLVAGAGRFLVKVGSEDTDLRVCSEAVDALIDVFTEDDTDAVAREIHLVTEIRSVAPRFKQMIRAAPKSENKLIASTCHSNLLRFIKYKSKRLN